MQTILKFIVSMYTRAADVADRERGATATEYALLVALIAIIISVGVGLFGTNLNAFFNKIAAQVATW